MRFCPQCGTPLTPPARFCVECGENLAALEPPASAGGAGAGSATTPPAPAPRLASDDPQPPTQASIVPFVAVFAAILIAGTVVAVLIMRQLPARNRLLASAPPSAATASSATDFDGTSHPQVKLPKEALDFIANLEQKANANPSNLSDWDKLGDVYMRAAMLNSSYYPKARDTYAHVLKLAPNDLGALRGIGNYDFDQRDYDAAIAAYEHYLSEKPDDPDVRTDLGTMYLSTSNPDQAVVQYQKVLDQHPKFFEAQFNIAIADGDLNKLDDAHSAFERALAIAPNAQDRDRVNQMLADLAKQPSNTTTASNASAAPPVDSTAPAAPSSGSFQDAMDQMLRGLPIAGPKVASVQWPSPTNARVLMDNFPMDQMPPFAAAKFLGDLKSGIDSVKTSHKITSPVQVDICDAATGHVMQTVTE
ncbi:MAG TPA: tetratricopeptide repeat protein [Candidatus Binataceae bacterium]|nr:tetratricopeptide repeat protein [Candidatus Binataceae bacterium]